MKTKLIELAKELEVPFEELFQQAIDKLSQSELSGRGKNTWVTEKGAEELRLNADIPEAVPEVLRGTVKHTAMNRLFVYAVIEGIEGKHPVLVGRRWGGDRLVGKPIEIHRIEDVNGISYRYAALTD
jgi:hypothetical protein